MSGSGEACLIAAFFSGSAADGLLSLFPVWRVVWSPSAGRPLRGARAAHSGVQERCFLRRIWPDPVRASALAAGLQSDLSTVSRQVTALVTRGLLERRADPVDGRASLLVVTAAGQAVIAAHEHARKAFFEEVLSDWSPGERGQFVHLLERFTAAYDTTHTHWMTGVARHPARTGEPEEGSTA
jgi:DNA-binding MarR family transcriptional regulator